MVANLSHLSQIYVHFPISTSPITQLEPQWPTLTPSTMPAIPSLATHREPPQRRERVRQFQANLGLFTYAFIEWGALWEGLRDSYTSNPRQRYVTGQVELQSDGKVILSLTYSNLLHPTACLARSSSKTLKVPLAHWSTITESAQRWLSTDDIS
jgi:hypothetical protein